MIYEAKLVSLKNKIEIKLFHLLYDRAHLSKKRREDNINFLCFRPDLQDKAGLTWLNEVDLSSMSVQ
jgi:hypothetical protein